MKIVKFPPGWRERLKSIPALAGAGAIAEILEIRPEEVVRLRRGCKEFDDLCLPIMKHNHGPLYEEPVSESPEVANPYLTLYPREIYPDDLLVCLRRAMLRMEYLPSGERELVFTIAEKRYMTLVLKAAHEKIERLQKERRSLLSDLNRIRTRLHELKRGGTPAIHASNGSARQSEI